MTYDEAIRFWYSRINYETRAAKPEDLRLGRMSNLLLFLEDPQDHVPTVHIAGTKGKGSTAAMIAGIAQAAGLNVGLFTSPHLVNVEERFRIKGEPISKADFAQEMTFLSVAIEAIETQSNRFTFFEIATALAWQYFRARNVDLAVMEVGLGGRFDSTNVCQPLVTVITSIGFDHMNQLGHTLEAIAYQKAGIIKPGVPVICGVTEPGPRQVIRDVAKEQRAPLIECDFSNLPERVNLLGEHQRRNAALAIAAVKQLNFNVVDDAITKALANVQWPARIEVMGRDPILILDSAHNVPSALALVATLRAEFPAANRKICVFAVSNDKQYREMLPILAEYFEAFVLTQYGNNPRCVPPETLATLLPEAVAKTIVTPAIRAFEFAKSQIEYDLICITGSVFLAGELRPLLSS